MQALLVIDMQRFVSDRITRGVEYFPAASIENMKTILASFRAAGKTVLHVRHETTEPGSDLQKDSPHFPPVEGFEEQGEENVFIKRTSSAFSSTDLYQWLQRENINELTVIGAVAGFCVNSTIRSGADLGLHMTIVRDAVLSFPLGEGLSAEAIFNVTLGLLEAGFARGVTTAELTQ
ncbi:isochorismatase family protein [Kluyvera sp. CHPC 1.251]|uniref:isochorismatase family protein n=1 Tax=Kluyvera sp. CHPC 1.251 TaxID=2995175 RepID=UPI002FD85DB7